MKYFQINLKKLTQSSFFNLTIVIVLTVIALKTKWKVDRLGVCHLPFLLSDSDEAVFKIYALHMDS